MTIIVVFVIVLVVGWWVLGAYNFVQPTPQRPDTNFDALINEFVTFPRELWFRDNPCVFDTAFRNTCRRYIVLESDGRVVYDSQPRTRVRGRYHIRAEEIPRTVEYQQASVTLEGYVRRNQTANMCRAIKEGSMYRMVHVSEYIFGQNDPEF